MARVTLNFSLGSKELTARKFLNSLHNSEKIEKTYNDRVTGECVRAIPLSAAWHDREQYVPHK